MLLNAPKTARTPILVSLLVVSHAVNADSSAGPDPYAEPYGFDLPEQSAWGRWSRGDAGTLHAEWDSFDDATHGSSNDRSAAPHDRHGLNSAWLGWNVGTFVAGSGNLYSFTVPESFSINLTGPAQSGPWRIALQVETQGQELDPERYRLNGKKPTQRLETYRNPALATAYGPANLIHTQVLWDLTSRPQNLLFELGSTVPHVSLTQVAVDVGPLANTGPVDDTAAARTSAIIGVTPEPLPDELVLSLHEQVPKRFPAAWADRKLVWSRTVRPNNQITTHLKTSTVALYYDPSPPSTQSNRVQLYIFRPRPGTDTAVIVAVCKLAAYAIRPFVRVRLDGQRTQLTTAKYGLDLRAKRTASQTTSRLTRERGACDIEPDLPGRQDGLPELWDGDFAEVRRAK